MMEHQQQYSKSTFYGPLTRVDPILDTIAQGNGPTNSSSSSSSASSGDRTPSTMTTFETAVQHLMSTREDDYLDFQKYRIFVGTWNVNGKSPPPSLTDWLASDEQPPDIYAIGFQELDNSKEAFLFADSPKEEEWLAACKKGLHPSATYIQVRLVRLIGMMLIIFVRHDLRDLVSNVQWETCGTGLLGRMGNKGGVAIRFDLCSTSMCFVNCHLAAHVEEYESRNQDYNEINTRLAFYQTSRGVTTCKAIQDHDQVYWFGDLNYRITDIDSTGVKDFLKEQFFEELLVHDQLKIQHSQKKVFIGYLEGDIRFIPTYKYDPGTDEWDSSEKNRPPAWCDRVLWRGGPTDQIVYRSHPSLKTSDHKPVSAIFDASVKVIDQVKYKKVYQDVMKRLDRLENEFLPQVKLDKTEVTFDSVSFRESVFRSFTVANTGQVVVFFSFLKKPNQTSFCKEWLRVHPSHGKIKPGDSLEIVIEIFVAGSTANRLTSGEDKLEDILVLHLEHGRDLFISVTGKYKPSVFGCSLDCLVRLPRPIRQVSDVELASLHKNPNNLPQSFDIPKEIWSLVDYLYKNGLDHEDMFLRGGLQSEFVVIRESLDTGWPQELSCSINSVSECLLSLLDSLTDPVIPFFMYQKSLDASHSFQTSQEVVSNLPATHKHVFFYLLSFLKELLRHSRTNRSDPKALAKVFSTVLIRPPPDTKANENPRIAESQQQAVDRKRLQFVYHFLVNDFE